GRAGRWALVARGPSTGAAPRAPIRLPAESPDASGNPQLCSRIGALDRLDFRDKRSALQTVCCSSPSLGVGTAREKDVSPDLLSIGEQKGPKPKCRLSSKPTSLRSKRKRTYTVRRAR